MSWCLDLLSSPSPNGFCIEPNGVWSHRPEVARIVTIRIEITHCPGATRVCAERVMFELHAGPRLSFGSGVGKQLSVKRKTLRIIYKRMSRRRTNHGLQHRRQTSWTGTRHYLQAGLNRCVCCGAGKTKTG